MNIQLPKNDNDFSKAVRPREFYRHLHPEYFSDTKVSYEIPLTRELFIQKMEFLSTNKQESAFENFAVAVSRRLLTPNIKSQTGPDGGGDGKVDAETYKVSQDISDKWFSEEKGATGAEKWALAISCKRQWRAKIQSDVEKCVGTQRGYTRILFLSNQYIKSSTMFDVKEQLSRKHGVLVDIFDRNWFLDAVFENGCLDIALDKLGFSDEYKKRTETVGPNDFQRKKRLEVVEEAISKPVFGLDTKYVDLMKEACLLCRGLERPRHEVEGRFRRAMDECVQHGTDQQMFNIIYDHGWTCHFWYEDFEAAYQDYLRLKQYVLNNCSVHRLEYALNLLSVLRSASTFGLFDAGKIDSEILSFNELEQALAKDLNRKSCHLYLRLRKAQYTLTLHSAQKQPIKDDLSTLRALIDETSGNLDISMESIYAIVEMISEQIDEDADFDRFVDELSDRVSAQRTEVEAARIRLARGIKHAKAKRWKEAIRHLSFCVYAFEKEECIRELIDSSFLMGTALRELNLPYSAESFFIKATGFLFAEFQKQGTIPGMLVEALENICEIELLLGRLVMYLNWRKLLMVIAQNAQVGEDDDFVKRQQLIEAAWVCRFAAADLSAPVFAKLPDLLERQGLWLSAEYLRYALGYTHLVHPDAMMIFGVSNDTRHLLNQPVFKQFLCELNIAQNGWAHLETSVNGFTFHVEYPNNCRGQQSVETILACMEALMATYEDLEVFVLHSSIYLRIAFSENRTELKTMEDVDKYEFWINKDSLSPEAFWKCLVSFIVYVFSRNAIVRNGDIAELLERKQNGERMMDRVSVLQHTSMAMGLVFGKSFKCKLEDWLKDSDKAYLYKGKPRPRPEIEYTNNVQTISTTILLNKDMSVWDAAGWTGCAVYADRSVPLAFGLMFSDEKKGRSIFEEWKRTLQETEPPIRIVILKGIDASHPFWYRVCIMPDVFMQLKPGGESRYLRFSSRCNTMEPTTNTNLAFLEREFSRLGRCRLAPMFIDSHGQVKTPVDWSLSFDFSKLTIMDAWKVGANAEYSCALSLRDNPLIPQDRKHDAPVLKALEQLRSFMQQKGNSRTEISV